jgi:uncharacterized protein YeaO (DUF488 family)
MAIRVVQLGSPRAPGEKLRLGTVRRPPRGVRKEDYSLLDFFDLWLPQLAPSAELLARTSELQQTEKGWKAFERTYLKELSTPDNQRLLGLLAAFSRTADFSLGCYCERERRCHRSILRRELEKRGAQIA